MDPLYSPGQLSDIGGSRNIIAVALRRLGEQKAADELERGRPFSIPAAQRKELLDDPAVHAALQADFARRAPSAAENEKRQAVLGGTAMPAACGTIKASARWERVVQRRQALMHRERVQRRQAELYANRPRSGDIISLRCVGLGG